MALIKKINEFIKFKSFSQFLGLLLKLNTPTINYKKYIKKQICPIEIENL